MDDLSSLYTSVPVVFVEIRPLHWIEETDDEKEQHRLTNFGVKRFLLGETQRARAHQISGFVAGSDASNEEYCIRWKDNGTTGDGLSSGYVFSNCDDSSHKDAVPILYIPSDNPIVTERQPCCVIAYAYQNNNPVAFCHFSEDMLVRILPPRLATTSLGENDRLSATTIPRSYQRDSFLSDLLGEDISEEDDEMMEQVLQSHNPETIDELTLKMSAATVSVRIGTTVDAIRVWEQHQRQLEKLQNSIQAFCGGEVEKRPTSNNKGFQSWPSLIVHSPRHADGKTLLVRALAKKRLGMVVHCIRPGALLAKYGVRADAALESQIHGILVSAACRKQTVCLLLDPLDAMVLSRRSSAGDAAGPVLNAMASYLRSITNSMQRKQQFPFPSKNPLYNPTCANTGQVLATNLCLVGIVTCPDDGGKSSTSSSSTILDCMVSDRYRLPLLTTSTILSAFEAAFHREGISLDPAARTKLALLASSSPWMRGGVFGLVARELQRIIEDADSTTAATTGRDLIRAMDRVKVELKADPAPNDSFDNVDEPEDETSSMHFESIGGNVQAKLSLEDALAFDPLKRELLAKFGLSPPTGVLLYGPPGCGKTLLAKAVARLLKSSNSSGGTFLSLKISEIVSSEIGTSEKTIAASFEFAEKNAPSVSRVEYCVS